MSWQGFLARHPVGDVIEGVARGELLIGADGVRSTLRSVIDPSAPAPRYTRHSDDRPWWFANVPWPRQPSSADLAAVSSDEWKTRLQHLTELAALAVRHRLATRAVLAEGTEHQLDLIRTGPPAEGMPRNSRIRDPSGNWIGSRKRISRATAKRVLTESEAIRTILCRSPASASAPRDRMARTAPARRARPGPASLA